MKPLHQSSKPTGPWSLCPEVQAPQPIGYSNTSNAAIAQLLVKARLSPEHHETASASYARVPIFSVEKLVVQ